LFHVAGAYRFQVLASAREAIGRAALGWIGVAGILLAISFLTKSSSEFSRAWSLLWGGSTVVLVAGARLIVAATIARWRESGRLSKTVVVIGAGNVGQRLLRHLNE